MSKLTILLLLCAQVGLAQQQKNWFERRKERLNRTEDLYQTPPPRADASPMQLAAADLRAGGNTLAAGLSIALVSAGVGILMQENSTNFKTGKAVLRAGIALGTVVSITGAFRIGKAGKRLIVQ